MLKLSSLYPIHCDGRAVSYALFSLCDQWQGRDLKARIVVASCEPSCRRPNLVEGVPPLLKWWYYRNADAPRTMAQKRFLKDLAAFDAAYIWPTTSLETFRKAREIGKPIFLERINCFQGKAKNILDDAYKRLGASPQHKITSENVQQEKAEADLADFIFSPSPEVAKSFQEAGVPEEKLILTSYGWSRERFPDLPSKTPVQDTFTVLFLATVSVRKGIHLLLRAWERSGVKGRLMIIGRMEQVIAETCGELLSRSDITYSDYRLDYTAAYREVDVFAIPSLEEGSPLVTYEAMAHSLPILASPMGAGGIVRDGIDGMIIPPYDEDAWVEALRKLANSPELRTQLGASARQQAEEFTWEKVAARRAELITERVRV